MVLKKQTVWLLSMLAILVVLSAYYLFQGPSQQVPVATGNTNDAGKTQGDLVGGNKDISVSTKEAAPETPAAAPSDDYFISYKMDRDARQEQEMDRFMEVMSNSDAKSETIAEARKKYDELAALKDNQTQVEELVKSAGSYKNVVVIAKDDMVRVIVQANSLKKEKAVEIISLVKQHMKVPGNNIVVSYKP
ncbi:SpoIIIAH-like family protein [Aneurinibacillus tyrosinisolvens]|uniref:SpoIIIAH-like family protein n=1 Tax=Aneurinibacillus tyrosinisolvens TaxID=1443435 RepID=UPI00063FB804|nr:SpoIIIAH-like family protein [Aneurinibacillus tyrosinisolvens]